MAPADTLAPAGSSSYASDTLNVGDGTWDYSKNTFLLPNLVGLNFETMRYNGMGNRFSSIPQYHSLVLGHGVLAAITFLFLIPISAMIARFYTRRTGYALRYHAYLNIVAVLLATAVLVLGWFAVGPNRSLTNPHHGIGVAIYVLILLQAIGGRLVRHLAGRHSFRLTIHRWSGRTIALLGIVQVPLGLTLYGSPKALFILYALWMGFLFLVYFILSYRHEGARYRDGGSTVREHSRHRRSEAESSSGGGGMLRWLAPLAAGAGIWAMMRGRHKHDEEAQRSRSRSRVAYSRSGSRSRSRSRSSSPRDHSRRESDSFVDEKYAAAAQRPEKKDGFFKKMLTAGAAAGAGILISNLLSKGKDGDKNKNRNSSSSNKNQSRLQIRERSRIRDEEYSAVDTDTPSRHGGRNSRMYRTPSRSGRQQSSRRDYGRRGPTSEMSSLTEDSRLRYDDRTASPTPGPRRHRSRSRSRSNSRSRVGTAAAAGAAGAAAGLAAAALSNRRHADNNNNNNNNAHDRPVTPPRPSHQRTHSYQHPQDSLLDGSDYSSYQSPSRRTALSGRDNRSGDGTNRGFLGGLGMGWLANKFTGVKGERSSQPVNTATTPDRRRRDSYDDRMRREEDGRRAGTRGSRYTGDGHPSPLRRDHSRRSETGYRPGTSTIMTGTAAGATTATTMTQSELSDLTDSALDSRPGASSYRPPPAAGGPPPPSHSTPPSQSHSQHQGQGQPRRSGSRHRPEIVAMPSMPDSDSELGGPGPSGGGGAGGGGGYSGGSRRTGSNDYYRRPPLTSSNNASSSQQHHPVSVRLKVNEDRGDVTLRRLTEAEAAAERERTGQAGYAGQSRSTSAAAQQPPSSSSRRRYDESLSSLSEADSPSARRYRRGEESSGGGSGGMRRAELSAEQRVAADESRLGGGDAGGSGGVGRSGSSRPPTSHQSHQSHPHLNPEASTSVLDEHPLDLPNPPFAGGKRPKDSAYYSGGIGGVLGGGLGTTGTPSSAAAGPSGTIPAAGHTYSSIDSHGSHGTWSGMSPSPATRARPGDSSQAPDMTSSAAAERRRRRRLERSDSSRQGTSRVDYQ